MSTKTYKSYRRNLFEKHAVLFTVFTLKLTEHVYVIHVCVSSSSHPNKSTIKNSKLCVNYLIIIMLYIYCDKQNKTKQKSIA